VTDPRPRGAPFSRNTAWARRGQAPLRRYLRTETADAAVLIAGVVVALAWANAAPTPYAAFWSAKLAVEVAGTGLSLSLQNWVNSGLMTFSSWLPGWRRGASSIWASCVPGGDWRCRSRPAWPG
jgi:Na+/H+ antiporter 1